MKRAIGLLVGLFLFSGLGYAQVVSPQNPQMTFQDQSQPINNGGFWRFYWSNGQYCMQMNKSATPPYFASNISPICISPSGNTTITNLTLNNPSFSPPIGVPSGGTGLGTITANGVLYGNGTSTVQTVVGGVHTVLASNGGAPTFSATPTIAALNNVLKCDESNSYPGSSMSRRATSCANSTPSTGGVADARGFQGPQTWDTDAFSGINKPIEFLCSAATITVSVNTTIPANVHWPAGQGCQFVVNSGVMLNIAGSMAGATDSVHFSGPGTVIITNSEPIQQAWFSAGNPGAVLMAEAGNITTATIDDNDAFQGPQSNAGGSVLYRCTSGGGNLRLGQTTTVASDCNTSVDTGQRVQ